MSGDDDQPYHDFDGKLRVEKYNGRKWRARASIGETGNYKYKYQSLKTNDRKEAIGIAKRWYVTIENKVNAGETVFEKSISDIAKDWLESFSKEVSLGKQTNNMLTVYKTTIGAHISEYFKDTPISKINSDAITKYFDWELEKEKRPSQKSLAWYSLTLKKLFEYAVQKGLIRTAPSFKTPSINEDPTNRSAFDPNEWAKIASYLPEWIKLSKNLQQKNMRVTMQHLIHILYNTGMRTSDITHLKWSDYNEFNQDNKIRCSFLCRGKSTGKGKVNLHTTIGELDTIVWMNSWKSYVRTYQPNDLIFPNKLLGRSLSDCFKELVEYLGLYIDKENKTRPLYSLRHTYATVMLAKEGVDIHTIAKNMGTNVKNIEQTYGHLSVNELTTKLGGRSVATGNSGTLGLINPAVGDDNVLVLRKKK